MNKDDAAKLVARTRQGDAGAFRQLVDAYKDRLYAFIWRIVRDHHEAEEVAQESFVKAFEALDSYSPKFAFSTWLYTIGYRLCLNRMRKRRPQSCDVNYDQVAATDDNDVAVELANSEAARKLRTEIWQAVEQLTDVQKTAVVLFYQEGQGCHEIGRIMGIPAVTVKSHLHRARAKLRELLSPEVAEEWTTIKFPGAARSA